MVRLPLLALPIVAVLIAPAAADPLDVFGTWATASGTSKVEIADCGDGTPCGRIAWVDPLGLAPESRDAVLFDENNPDPSRHSDTIIGLALLKGFEKGGDRWRRGKIYDPEEGKTYRSTIARIDDTTLSVKGCLSVICQEQVWTWSPMTEIETLQAAVQKGE